MAVLFVKMVDAQLPIPLPELPIPLPEIPALPLLPLLPAVVLCPAGFFTLLDGCAPCPAGTASSAAGLCLPCPLGTYAPGPGSASCVYCAVGTYAAPARDTCICNPAKATKATKVDSKKGGGAVKGKKGGKV